MGHEFITYFITLFTTSSYSSYTCPYSLWHCGLCTSWKIFHLLNPCHYTPLILPFACKILSNIPSGLLFLNVIYFQDLILDILSFSLSMRENIYHLEINYLYTVNMPNLFLLPRTHVELRIKFLLDNLPWCTKNESNSVCLKSELTNTS